MITWMRPSGNKIETNESDAIIEYAINAGWEQIKEAVTDDNSTTDSKRSSRTRKRKNR